MSDEVFVTGLTTDKDNIEEIVEETTSAIANKAKLNKDAYMFNVLKYVLRQEKPGEPRSRDVKKIREYADIWLENDKVENPGDE